MQIAFGVGCALVMIALRSTLDIIAPTSGPFALVYPAVLIATLFGHWRAGLTTWFIAFLWGWYYVLPFPNSFRFELASDPMSVSINVGASLIIILLAEKFRSAVRGYADELERAAERRLVLLAELEHRTKNNFALVASLLEIQKRRQTDPVLVRALDDASGRVRTFASAYSNLTEEQAEGYDVAMKPYLEQLIDRVGGASFAENVTIESDIAAVTMPRERGVAIGLFLNEAVANSAKYAFADGRAGTIRVAFTSNAAGEGWSLLLEDNGAGTGAVPNEHSGGIGTNLMAAFAQQADATHEVRFSGNGCHVELCSKPPSN